MAECAQCRQKPGQRDGLCPGCRLRAHGLAQAKYRWTDELREELRSAYGLAQFERAAAIRRMSRRTGWPHQVFREEAVRLGITRWRREASVKIRTEPINEWSEMDLQQIFGVRRCAIKAWLRRGLFGRQLGAVTAEAVVRFIREYPHEYDLRRVDQVLYKALVFGRLAEVE